MTPPIAQPTEQQIIDEVRGWIGTKWGHMMKTKGHKADCAQYIVCVGKTFGWIPQGYQTAAYSRDYALHNSRSFMREEVSKFAEEVKDGIYRPGDVMLFVYGQCASHAGIYIGNGIVVHSHIRQGVIETRLKDIPEQLDSVWRFNGAA